ncbi:hypothetical protein IB239_08220 [Pseudomonas sp. PDM12]|uniref:hypothetical protein n=1 Tax=Pseudomonas sp. PDM12 TaxID=2769260 RepID=UPI00177B5F34|nr:MULTISPECIES: hypothetical protein [unclassified Pseudomonas]MBD9654793.1 hypothetical protein [Pseudomonas sp. PDM12]
MAVEHNESGSAFESSSDKQVDTGAGHGSGLEKAKSEPKQGANEAEAKKNRVEWNPPAGNPGSDQDALKERDIGSARTDER